MHACLTKTNKRKTQIELENRRTSTAERKETHI